MTGQILHCPMRPPSCLIWAAIMLSLAISESLLNGRSSHLAWLTASSCVWFSGGTPAPPASLPRRPLSCALTTTFGLSCACAEIGGRSAQPPIPVWLANLFDGSAVSLDARVPIPAPVNGTAGDRRPGRPCRHTARTDHATQSPCVNGSLLILAWGGPN